METILEFLNSGSVVTVVVGFMIIGFSKAIISIFRMGVTFKSNLVSRTELDKFELDIKREMRSANQQIQKTTIDAVMRVIDARLSDIEGLKNTATEIKVLKAELESEIKHSLEKYDEIKSIGDSVRALSNKVSRMEYKDSTATATRRTEK